MSYCLLRLWCSHYKIIFEIYWYGRKVEIQMAKLKKLWNTFMVNWWDIYRHICYWFECKLFCLNRSQISRSLTCTISLSSSLPHKNIIPSQTHLPAHNRKPKFKKNQSPIQLIFIPIVRIFFSKLSRNVF